MKQKHKTWSVIVCALALTTITALPIGSTTEQPPEDDQDRLNDVVACIVKTTGTLVGYKDFLDTVDEVANLHLVNNERPYRAMGLFEYHGQIAGHHRYLILSGYSDGADWCRGPVEDLISDSSHQVS